MDEYMTKTCLTFEDRAGRPEIEHYVLIRGDQTGYVFHIMLFLVRNSSGVLASFTSEKDPSIRKDSEKKYLSTEY